LEADATKAITDTILVDRLEEAALMLAHAAETGQELKPEVVATIANAREAFARGAWTIDLTKQFWPAYGQLCSAIKPVTGESLLACLSKGLARTLARYRTGTFWLALVILPLSVVMFMNTSISNEISQQVKDNDALAVTLRDQLLAIPQSVTDRISRRQRRLRNLSPGARVTKGYYHRAPAIRDGNPFLIWARGSLEPVRLSGRA
jgi:hypothetical protein